MQVDKKIFGIGMNRKRNRRWLVSVMYLVLASLFWAILQLQSNVASLLFTVAILGNMCLFGGHAVTGLLKPFHRDNNDERELSARDRAHYLAYGPVICALVIPMWIPELIRQGSLTSAHGLLFIQEFLWAGYTLALTLPQAILLWTEPDIDSEPSYLAATPRS